MLSDTSTQNDHPDSIDTQITQQIETIPHDQYLLTLLHSKHKMNILQRIQNQTDKIS